MMTKTTLHLACMRRATQHLRPSAATLTNTCVKRATPTRLQLAQTELSVVMEEISLELTPRGRARRRTGARALAGHAAVAAPRSDHAGRRHVGPDDGDAERDAHGVPVASRRAAFGGVSAAAQADAGRGWALALDPRRLAR
eukprot:967498-Pleurochrysis_carterae.AAC.1